MQEILKENHIYLILNKEANRRLFCMLDIENLIEKLRESIEEKNWILVEEVLNIIAEELDNPLDEYRDEEDW